MDYGVCGDGLMSKSKGMDELIEFLKFCYNDLDFDD